MRGRAFLKKSFSLASPFKKLKKDWKGLFLLTLNKKRRVLLSEAPSLFAMVFITSDILR